MSDVIELELCPTCRQPMPPAKKGGAAASKLPKCDLCPNEARFLRSFTNLKNYGNAKMFLCLECMKAFEPTRVNR